MSSPQLWLSVVEVGCFFALLGLAYLVVLEGTGFFNLAIGPYAMLGPLVWAGLIDADLDKWVAFAVAIVVVLVVAALTEVVIVRRVEARSRGDAFPALMAAVALVFALSQLAGMWSGRKPVPGPRLLEAAAWRIGPVQVPASLLVAVVLTALAFGGVAILVRATDFGRLLRAVGDNEHAAAVLGAPVPRIRLLASLLGGLIACLAGMAFAAKGGGVVYDIGLHWALLGFLAVVIGGTGSWFAPLVGGLFLGVAEVMVPFHFGGGAADYAVLVFALVFFAFRPQGLLIRRVRV